MMHSFITRRMIALGVFISLAAPAAATQYFTLDQVQHDLFPAADSFTAQTVHLTAEQKDFVENYAHVHMRADEQPVWRVESKGGFLGWLVLDEVYGKREPITYAVGLNPDGSVKGLQIMDYREKRGGEVRAPDWRAQFIGKRYGDALQPGQDIDAISGATLSSQHLSEGVRRVLAIYQTALKPQTGR